MRQKSTTKKRQVKKTPQLYHCDLENNFITETCDIYPGDRLLLVYADEDREPQDGEIVFMHFYRRGNGCGCIDAGIFRQEEEGYFTITHDDDGSDAVNNPGSTYLPSAHDYLMRVVAVKRSGTVKWLTNDEQRLGKSKSVVLPDPTDDLRNETDEEKKQKIARLRARLRALDTADDITNCSARFRLEKQIYDLEHKLGDDEWPEVIGDE